MKPLEILVSKCGRSSSLSYIWVDGSCPFSREVRNAIANTPQSVPFVCYWTGLMCRTISGAFDLAVDISMIKTIINIHFCTQVASDV